MAKRCNLSLLNFRDKKEVSVLSWFKGFAYLAISSDVILKCRRYHGDKRGHSSKNDRGHINRRGSRCWLYEKPYAGTKYCKSCAQDYNLWGKIESKRNWGHGIAVKKKCLATCFAIILFQYSCMTKIVYLRFSSHKNTQCAQFLFSYWQGANARNIC